MKVLVNGDRVLLSFDPEGGSILVFLENKELKIAFIVIGEGRTDFIFSTSNVLMVRNTWLFLPGIYLTDY